MRFSELTNGGGLQGAHDVEISGLSADSRTVRPGYLFAALAGGNADGADYIEEAVAHGAAAVLAGVDAGPNLREIHLPWVTDENPRHRLALMAARFYGAQPDVVAAVTGTNGKTSAVNFVRQIWQRFGYRAASMGTLGVIAPGVEEPLAHTTPDPITLHHHLARLAEQGIDHLALEASSHGLDQCRLDGTRVQVGAFTNLSRDHLDYHADAADYLATKLRLFDTVMAPGGTVVVNADCDVYAAVAVAAEGAGHRVSAYGRRGDAVRVIEETPEPTGQRLTIEVEGEGFEVGLPLAGSFQASNALCALAVVLACGADRGAAVASLEHLAGVPGRMDLVGRHPAGAAVYVDYAHTPDALETVLKALRPHTRGRLVVVFGCGGDRDTGKRPVMGRVAAENADRVFVTDDNPRGENPAAIRREILVACPEAAEIGDRAEAIRAAVSCLGGDDVLVIAGKGHEQGQTVGGRTRPFDDTVVARAALAALAEGGS